MLLNADFSRRAVVLPQQYQWAASPQPGVERVMLDRIGAEKARATSIVRYAPGSFFPGHQHPGGEEILVLSGTFSDDSDHYPAGWYLRNPPGSEHQPFTREGALIFVKLRQMPPGEQCSVRIDTRDPSRWKAEPGRESCLLFTQGVERVVVQRLAKGGVLDIASAKGAEILVLQGALLEGSSEYPQGSWLRLPAGDTPRLLAADHGATAYVKTGHLAAVHLNTLESNTRA